MCSCSFLVDSLCLMIGAGWKEYPKGVQVVLIFMTLICLEVRVLWIREVWQCVYTV